MRERFPRLNKESDEELSKSALARFAEETEPVARVLASDHSSDARERFTYSSMIHSALYHHKVRAVELGISAPEVFERALADIERTMMELASDIGVEHRFLSAFYLFYNPEIPDIAGKFAQFRPSEYETAFLRINREGTLQYKQGAMALSEAVDKLDRGIASVEFLKSRFERAAASFRKISNGNAMLLNAPGGEEFKFLTQYFGEVQIAGKTLRGVNAGDQPWSYSIDLLLGVDLKRVFERAFEGTPSERHYTPEIRTSAEVVAFEFQSGEYLHPNYLLPEDYAALTRVIEVMNHSGETLLSFVRKTFSKTERKDLAIGIHAVIKHYLAASNVHYQLARRHVPTDTHGEQIGSAGTNIVKFLKEGLNAEREKMKRELEHEYPELLKKEAETIIE